MSAGLKPGGYVCQMPLRIVVHELVDGGLAGIAASLNVTANGVRLLSRTGVRLLSETVVADRL